MPGFAAETAQTVLGLVHELTGPLDVRSDKLAVPFDNVAPDDHGLDVRRSRAQHHHGDRVAEPVEVR